MPLACKICSSASRAEIEELFLQGASHRELARNFKTFSRTTVYRHVQNHISHELSRLFNQRPEEQPPALGSAVLQLQGEARQLRDKAKQRGDLKTALMGVREEARLIELYARLTGQLQPKKPQITVDDVISDDHAQRIMDGLMERMLEDPQRRALIEQKLGLAPAIDAQAVEVKSEC
jgi:hypothetical protein